MRANTPRIIGRDNNLVTTPRLTVGQKNESEYSMQKKGKEMRK